MAKNLRYLGPSHRFVDEQSDTVFEKNAPASSVSDDDAERLLAFRHEHFEAVTGAEAKKDYREDYSLTLPLPESARPTGQAPVTALVESEEDAQRVAEGLDDSAQEKQAEEVAAS